MANWLVFIHSSNSKDHKYADRYLKSIRQNLNQAKKSVNVYVIQFGPTKRSPAVLLLISNHESRVIKTITPPEMGSVVDITADFIRTLKGVPIDAICGSFHGSGFCMGPWKGTKQCFMTITDFVKHVVKPLKVKLVCFDSCYMGNMTCLYEMPNFVQYVVASPGFHPYVSILSTQTFVELSTFKNRQQIVMYVKKLTCEWTIRARKRAAYSCLLVFDMIFIPTIANLVKTCWPDLNFGKHSQIDKEDSNLSDLYSASLASHNVKRQNGQTQRANSATTSVEQLQQAIKNCVVDCGTIRPCSTVHGPSVERRMPRKWQSEYKATQWYSKVLCFHW